KTISREVFINEDHHIETFAALDDTDIISAVKVWARSDDKVLAKLCTDFITRKLYHVDITNEPADENAIAALTEKAMKKYSITPHEAQYFVFKDTILNHAYKIGDGFIRILMKDGSIKDIT